MADYKVKFLFADAVTIEQEFPGGVVVRDAKSTLIANWPAGKEAVESPDDIKMIYAGKVLENAKTFEDYKIPRGNQVVMHLQPKPASAKVEAQSAAGASGKQQPEAAKCCVIC